jgi:hypothetical protein
MGNYYCKKYGAGINHYNRHNIDNPPCRVATVEDQLLYERGNYRHEHELHVLVGCLLLSLDSY